MRTKSQQGDKKKISKVKRLGKEPQAVAKVTIPPRWGFAKCALMLSPACDVVDVSVEDVGMWTIGLFGGREYGGDALCDVEFVTCASFDAWDPVNRAPNH